MTASLHQLVRLASAVNWKFAPMSLHEAKHRGNPYIDGYSGKASSMSDLSCKLQRGRKEKLVHKHCTQVSLPTNVRKHRRLQHNFLGN